MKRSRSDYQAKNEYRIICSGFGSIHALHVFNKPSLKKAQEAVEQNNTDPVFLTDPAPAHRGCVPWQIETRCLAPWGTEVTV